MPTAGGNHGWPQGTQRDLPSLLQMLHPFGVPRCSPCAGGSCRELATVPSTTSGLGGQGGPGRRVPKPGGAVPRLPPATRVPCHPQGSNLRSRGHGWAGPPPPPCRQGAGPSGAPCSDWPLMYESGAQAGGRHVVAGDLHVAPLRWSRRFRGGSAACSGAGRGGSGAAGGTGPGPSSVVGTGAPWAGAGSASHSEVGEFVPLWAQTRAERVRVCLCLGEEGFPATTSVQPGSSAGGACPATSSLSLPACCGVCSCFFSPG